MFISISLTTPSARKEKRTDSERMPRVGADTFRRFSKAKQKQYLEKYPKSSHRFVASKPSERRKEVVGKKPDKKKVDKKNKKFPRKIDRKAYDALTPREQRAYDREYSGDRKFVGKKHILAKKKNAAQLKKKAIYGRAPIINKLERLSKEQEATVKAHRAQAHQDLKASINPEAVNAIKQITNADLGKAADNLRNNREEILSSLEDKLENERLDNTEVTAEDKEELQKRVDRGEDENPAELEEIIKSKKPSRKQKRVVEDVLQKPKENFLQRDISTMGKILRGEKVDKEGKSNFLVAASILGRYALVAGGVALVAMGAGPLAIHIAKEIYDNWDSLSAKEQEEEYGIEQMYDSFVDYLGNMETEALKDSVAKVKFTSVSSASRISYRSVPEERHMPIANRTRWRVVLNNKQVGEIYAEHDSEIQQNIRIWRAYVTEGFNALEFPHVDEYEGLKEPYILTNDDENTTHNLELHCPSLMTLTEARAWVCSIIEKGGRV